MDSEDLNTHRKNRGRKGAAAGIIIILLGVFWLLRKMGMYIPGWVFDWEMILIYIGLAIGISSGFRNNASWILI
ncbi:MAG: LiaF transmembrane domain-containing protein, partial [Owenweeksia sp.]